MRRGLQPPSETVPECSPRLASSFLFCPSPCTSKHRPTTLWFATPVCLTGPWLDGFDLPLFRSVQWRTVNRAVALNGAWRRTPCTESLILCVYRGWYRVLPSQVQIKTLRGCILYNVHTSVYNFPHPLCLPYNSLFVSSSRLFWETAVAFIFRIRLRVRSAFLFFTFLFYFSSPDQVHCNNLRNVIF